MKKIRERGRQIKMSILEKEMTKYPLKVKSEIAALGHLQKGLTVIEKN